MRTVFMTLMILALSNTLWANMYVKDEKVNKATPLQAGDRCPEFKFEDVSGKMVSSKDLKGKYLFIDIWATWCPPCRDELPYLQELEEKFKGKNIHFVSISCDNNKQKWQQFVKDKNLGGIQLRMGDDWSFMEAFGNRKIPRFVLVSPKGIIISPKASRPSEAETEEMLWSLKGIHKSKKR